MNVGVLDYYRWVPGPICIVSAFKVLDCLSGSEIAWVLQRPGMDGTLVANPVRCSEEGRGTYREHLLGCVLL